MINRFRRNRLPLTTARARFAAELRRRGRGQRTIDRYTSSIERFTRLVGDIPVTKVTTDDCRRHLDSFTGCKQSTLAIETTILARFFGFLVDERELDVDPMARVKRPKVPKDPEVKTVSSDDIARMLAAAQTWPEKLCIGFFAFTGARREGAAFARWRDVDFQRGTIRLREKGGKHRDVSLADELRVVLMEYLSHQQVTPDMFVIPNRRPTTKTATRSDRTVYNILLDVSRRARVDATPHSIRRAFAVRYLEQNPDRIVDLQQILGHDNIETTMRYVREYTRRLSLDTARTMHYPEAEAA